ncbi:unnamed protein product [Protopolystoma xenopodis]|uniref:Uncharacterized protein n=1 Tax=Protopolystoma xenopodis TaxID=117903 RepID=A0A3S5FBM3_9PLAT|nr:unnamed protein product [Protopolystoma xenopodis]
MNLQERASIRLPWPISGYSLEERGLIKRRGQLGRRRPRAVDILIFDRVAIHPSNRSLSSINLPPERQSWSHNPSTQFTILRSNFKLKPPDLGQTNVPDLPN